MPKVPKVEKCYICKQPITDEQNASWEYIGNNKTRVRHVRHETDLKKCGGCPNFHYKVTTDKAHGFCHTIRNNTVETRATTSDRECLWE